MNFTPIPFTFSAISWTWITDFYRPEDELDISIKSLDILKTNGETNENKINGFERHEKILCENGMERGIFFCFFHSKVHIVPHNKKNPISEFISHVSICQNTITLGERTIAYTNSFIICVFLFFQISTEKKWNGIRIHSETNLISHFTLNGYLVSMCFLFFAFIMQSNNHKCRCIRIETDYIYMLKSLSVNGMNKIQKKRTKENKRRRKRRNMRKLRTECQKSRNLNRFTDSCWMCWRFMGSHVRLLSIK